jgi:hypothetical protein
VKALRVRLDALERKLAEFEKDRLEAVRDIRVESEVKALDDAKAARLEQRVAILEKARKEDKTPPRGADPAESVDERSMTVVAPFVVKDRAGKTIMVVQDAGDDASGGAGSRGLYIYGRTAGTVAVAHVGVANDNDAGRIFTARPAGTRPDIVMGYFGGGPVFYMHTPTATGEIATISKNGFALYGGGAAPAAELTTKDGGGRFFLNNATGAHMVEAGSLASGKGYVLANPFKPSTALTGDPSVLRGGGGGKP